MNENVKWVAAAVAVVGLSVGAVIYRDKWWSDRPPAAKEPAVAAPVEPVVPEEPPIAHPLPAAENQEALPSLDDSDPSARNALEGLMGKEAAQRFIVPESLIRHMVVTVDNLTTEKVAERLRPVRPAPGKFVVSGSEEAPVLDPANYERYEPLVETIRTTDTQSLVASYVRYYPLFQEAYESLGHPPQYFNDRLIEVIDHLLATPEVPGPIALAQPGVQYVYADPELESRSAGQKALIRMGPDNAKAIKAKLRELRTALAAQRPS
jgi:hypothetical protein